MKRTVALGLVEGNWMTTSTTWTSRSIEGGREWTSPDYEGYRIVKYDHHKRTHQAFGPEGLIHRSHGLWIAVSVIESDKEEREPGRLTALLEEVCDDPDVMEEALLILGKERPVAVMRAIEQAQERPEAETIREIL